MCAISLCYFPSTTGSGRYENVAGALAASVISSAVTGMKATKATFTVGRVGMTAVVAAAAKSLTTNKPHCYQ